MFYTGVGSRKTTKIVLELMAAIAIKMAIFGYTLRTGDAQGADRAFREATLSARTLGPDYKVMGGIVIAKPEVYTHKDCTEASMAIAAKYHPAWDRCSDFAKLLHGRNSFQVLGRHLNDPSTYCICWTPDGATSHKERCYDTGGTGTAISIANAYNVPVVNLAIPSHFKMWEAWVNQPQ